LFFAFTLTNAIYANALDCGQPRSFINGQRSVAGSHPEDRRYLCRYHSRNEISMRLCEIVEAGKKQDLTPLMLNLA